MEGEVLLHWLKFDIQTHSLDFLPWLNRLYASNDLRRQFPQRAANIHLQVERMGSSDALAITPLQPGIFAETRVLASPCFYQDGKFQSRNSAGFAHEFEYDALHHSIRCNLGGAFLRSGQLVVTHFIRPLMQSFILPFYGLKWLHGALVTRRDRTFFLTGSGGAGKSTTALSLLQHGFSLLSEDGPLFFLDAAEDWVLSSLDFPHVAMDTLQQLPFLQPHVLGEMDDRAKFPVARSVLNGHEEWKTPRQVTHLIELERTPEVNAPMLIPLGRREVLLRMVAEAAVVFRALRGRESGLPLDRYSGFILDLITRLVSRAKIFRLRFADAQLGQVAELLDSL
jgi:hypothetical protein